MSRAGRYLKGAATIAAGAMMLTAPPLVSGQDIERSIPEPPSKIYPAKTYEQEGYHTTEPLTIQEEDPEYQKLIKGTKKDLMEEYPEVFCRNLTTGGIYGKKGSRSPVSFPIGQRVCQIPEDGLRITYSYEGKGCESVDNAPDRYIIARDLMILGEGEIMYHPETGEAILDPELYLIDTYHHILEGEHLYEKDESFSKEENVPFCIITSVLNNKEGARKCL